MEDMTNQAMKAQQDIQIVTEDNIHVVCLVHTFSLFEFIWLVMGLLNRYCMHFSSPVLNFFIEISIPLEYIILAAKHKLIEVLIHIINVYNAEE